MDFKFATAWTLKTLHGRQFGEYGDYGLGRDVQTAGLICLMNSVEFKNVWLELPSGTSIRTVLLYKTALAKFKWRKRRPKKTDVYGSL